jgi:hypothetical protein
MDQNGVWGTQNEMLVLAHMAEINIASFNTHERRYNFCFPGVIDYNAYPEDDPLSIWNTLVTTLM